VGALPGLGPVTGIALLLPLTFGMEPLSGLLLLVGIYQGCMFGGRISSILINVPGDPAAVVTTFDGYPLTQKGRAGFALTLSALASFFGSIVGFIGLAFLSVVFSKFAVKFGPPEYFALMLFALISTSGILEKRPFKAMIVTVLGLLMAMMGNDFVTGEMRLAFDSPYLYEGIDFVPVTIGIFGVSEVLSRIGKADYTLFKEKIPNTDLFPKVREVWENFGAMVRGTFIGFIVGVLPGAGATVATFLAYGVEKKISKEPDKFGTGVPQGLASPEAANNASVGGSLVPLFTLGIPGSGTAAILLGALMMMGLKPGPLLFQTSGDIVWGVIGGLLVANIMLVILNTVFVPAFVTMIRVIDPYLVPVVSALCIFGIYVLNYRMFEVWIMLIFGIIGYIMRKLGYPLAPLVLALILGQTTETSLRQSLIMSEGSWSIFFLQPIAAVLMLANIAMLLWPLIGSLRARRNKEAVGR